MRTWLLGCVALFSTAAGAQEAGNFDHQVRAQAEQIVALHRRCLDNYGQFIADLCQQTSRLADIGGGVEGGHFTELMKSLQGHGNCEPQSGKPRVGTIRNLCDDDSWQRLYQNYEAIQADLAFYGRKFKNANVAKTMKDLEARLRGAGGQGFRVSLPKAPASATFEQAYRSRH